MRALLLALALGVPSAAAAQSARDSVLAAVNDFFRTMSARDSAGSAGVVRADGVMYSVRESGDTTLVRRAPNEGYLSTVQGQREAYVERIWDPTVLVHKQIATVWAPYDFHRDGKFSHCGVDVFTLVQEKGRWRIVTAAYTVEVTGCKPSPLGPLR